MRESSCSDVYLQANEIAMRDVDRITIGDYIVIQKQKYFKLHQLNTRCDIMLGKQKVYLSAIVGQPYCTTFKMLQKGKGEFDLEVTTQVESLPEAVMKEISSGSDNRNITDDGKSQLLTTEEIVAFRDSGLSAQNIVGKLIESSTTFRNKTEYSQEKYLKKKEKKYFEYIVIRKPTIRLLAHIFYSKDQFSVLGLRHDSIAQIISYGNIQYNGVYVLFESGTQALMGAAILDCLSSDKGTLINITVGKYPPKQAILGMNFPTDKMKTFLSVRYKDFITSLNTNGKLLSNTGLNHEIRQTEPSPPELQQNNKPIQSHPCNEYDKTTTEGKELIDAKPIGNCDTPTLESNMTKKRKQEEDDPSELTFKRPKWQETMESAVDVLTINRADGIVFACKEVSFGLLDKLLDFLKPSRQFVVYCVYREPLVQLYVELKKSRKDVIGLHIYENWLRNHQILVNRTHPDVTMSPSGGHILVGTKVITS